MASTKKVQSTMETLPGKIIVNKCSRSKEV
jgi:hypothetical protein